MLPSAFLSVSLIDGDFYASDSCPWHPAENLGQKGLVCVGGVNECHSSFILGSLLKSWVEYINQASIYSKRVGKQKLLFCHFQEREFDFYPGPLGAVWICCHNKDECGFQGYQGKPETAKGKRFGDSSLSQEGSEVVLSVVSVRRGEDCPISTSVCSPRWRISSLLSKKYLLQLNFLLGCPWNNSKKDWTSVLVLPLAGCVTWGPLWVLVPSL